MYTEKHVIPLFLKACPGWKVALEKERANWPGEKTGLYQEISSFAHYLVSAYKNGTTSDFPKTFNTLEVIIQEGNNQAKELVVVGLIEDLQNTLSSDSIDTEAFKPWLREESRKAWHDVEKLREKEKPIQPSELQLIKEAQEAEKNGDFIPLDDVAKELGFDPRKLQGNH